MMQGAPVFTYDFVMGQLRLALVAALSFAGGKGWLTPTDAGVLTALATAIGPLVVPWIWSIATNLGKINISSGSAAAMVATVEVDKPRTAMAAATTLAGQVGTALAVFLLIGFSGIDHASAQTKSDPAVNLAVKLRVLTSDKLQAALDDALNNGDPYSPDCYRALQPIVAAAETVRITAKPTAGGDINLVLLYQKGRDLRRAAQSLQAALNGGGNVDIVRACAPMALDSETVINQVISLIGGAALIVK